MLNLWSKFEQAIEAARSFTVTVVDAGQKVAAKAVGLLSRAGRFVIIRLSPASNRILYKAFEEPVVKNVYFSNRVSTGLANQTPAVLTEDATVYMVSDNYALNFYPNSGGTVAYFNGAVDFSISVENEFMDRLGFTTSDKSKVRMFYYHDSTHTWIRLDSNFNASADTVACRVLRAGSYALGIEVSPSDDKQAPDIRELYPPEGATVPPDAVLKARLIDQTTGSGLAVAECKLLLDGKELATIWDSANELLFSEAVGEMDAGPHQLQVVAVDQNGNTSTVFSHFIVSNTGVNLDEVAPLQFRIVQNYPNPFNNHTKIFYYIPGDGQVKVMIFDERGRHVVTLSDQMQNAGDHQVEWDGTDSSGRNVPTGVYFYQIRFGDKTWVKKMSCIR